MSPHQFPQYGRFATAVKENPQNRHDRKNRRIPFRIPILALTVAFRVPLSQIIAAEAILRLQRKDLGAASPQNGGSHETG